MTRILIKCPNPNCNQAIPLLADAEIRIRFAPKDKAEFVHEELEKTHMTEHSSVCDCEVCKPEPELGVGDCVIQESTKPEIIPSPATTRTNEALWFEAVMTEWQPRDLFMVVVAKCKELGMFTKSIRTLHDIYGNGIYTTIQRDAILKAYEEAKE